MNKAYIDVRGVWPVYIKGLYTVTLYDTPRGITVEQAEEYILGLR